MRTPISSDDLRQFEQCAITQEAIIRAGIFRVDNAEGAEIIGRKPNNGASYEGVVFPYRWPGSNDVREYRLRRDHPDLEQKADGTIKPQRKYLTPPGRGNVLYFAPDACEQALTNPEWPITIVEGEKKTIALQSYYSRRGEPHLVIGLAGVSSWRGRIAIATDDRGARRPVKGVIPDFERIQWDGREVEILFDADASSNAQVRSARHGLSVELRLRGASVRVLDMPAESETNAKGIDDLLGIKGAEYVAQWLQEQRELPVREVDLGYTDEGFLNRFAEGYGEHFRFIAETGQLLSWDGAKWDSQHGEAMLWQAFGEASLDYEQIELLKANDEERCRRFFTRYRNTTGKQALTVASRHDMRFRASEEQFDAHPWLLNCQNGTLDLRTGELLLFDRSHYLTHQIPVDYDPEAKGEEWDNFIVKFTRYDKKLREFVLSWLYYCLSGDTSAQVFVLWQGKPNSGKGTIARLMNALLGKQLAKEAARGAFCHKEYDNVSHQDFLAQLKGRRFVIQSEFEDKKLDTGLIKQVSGQDSIYASAKGKSGDDYLPTYKLNLFSNLPPIFNVEDDAVQRRMRTIPCDYVPTPEELADKEFEQRLHAELPGILANLLSEGREYYFKYRLAPSEQMQSRAAVIAEAQNPFKEWLLSFYEVPGEDQIKEACGYRTDKHPLRIERSEINRDYDAYCKENGYKPIGRARKLMTLSKLGVSERKIGGIYYLSPLQRKIDDD